MNTSTAASPNVVRHFCKTHLSQLNNLTRIILLVALLTATSLKTKCQEGLQGSWYMLSGNRIIEWTIVKDSLISEEINWDLKSRSPDQEPIIKIIGQEVIANGNIYLYLKTPKDTFSHLTLSTIKIVKPKKEIIVVINSIGNLFTDTSIVRKYINRDVDKKYGYIFYSEPEIRRLQNQKSIKMMTIEDFKLYASKLLKFEVEIDSLSKTSNLPNNSLYLKFSMLRNIIGQIGYNPLLTNREFSEFINRFHQKEQTKEISSKLFYGLYK